MKAHILQLFINCLFALDSLNSLYFLNSLSNSRELLHAAKACASQKFAQNKSISPRKTSAIGQYAVLSSSTKKSISAVKHGGRSPPSDRASVLTLFQSYL
jgi:hypothetical protein